MAQCEICEKECQTFVFGEGIAGLDPLSICRTCQGKLILSLPKTPDVTQVKMAINSLYERIQDDKSRKNRFHSDTPRKRR